MRTETLRPVDLPVAIHLAMVPSDGYENLSQSLGISTGAAHRAVGRLEKAELLVPAKRTTILDNLEEFVIHGVRYAFYPVIGPETIGIATGTLAGQEDNGPLVGGDSHVWPTASGSDRGLALTPLYPKAISTPLANPPLYRALAIVDGLRIGGARERREAGSLFKEMVTRWRNRE